MSRRLMLRNAPGGGGDEIPIGVNLADRSNPDMFYPTSFWKQTTIGSSTYEFANDSQYDRWVFPFDSSMLFELRNLIARYSIRNYLVDQNGIVRWQGQNTDGAELKSIALGLESESVKIKWFYANSTHRNDYTVDVGWTRVS